MYVNFGVHGQLRKLLIKLRTAVYTYKNFDWCGLPIGQSSLG